MTKPSLAATLALVAAVTACGCGGTIEAPPQGTSTTTGDPPDLQLVQTSSGVERRADGFAVVLYDVPRGCCATYFPEANPLVPLEAVAVGSNTPASKSIPVRLVPA